MALWSNCPINVFSSLSKSFSSKLFSLRSALNASISFFNWPIFLSAKSCRSLKSASAWAWINFSVPSLRKGPWSGTRGRGIGPRAWWAPASFDEVDRPIPADERWWSPFGPIRPWEASRNRMNALSYSLKLVIKSINYYKIYYEILIHQERGKVGKERVFVFIICFKERI